MINTAPVTNVIEGVLGFLFGVFKKGFKTGVMLTLGLITLMWIVIFILTAIVK